MHRTRRDWTLRQLGEIAKLSPSLIQKFELGIRRVNMGDLERIARALGVEPYDLAGEQDRLALFGGAPPVPPAAQVQKALTQNPPMMKIYGRIYGNRILDMDRVVGEIPNPTLWNDRSLDDAFAVLAPQSVIQHLKPGAILIVAGDQNIIDGDILVLRGPDKNGELAIAGDLEKEHSPEIKVYRVVAILLR
jgi:transcriptional regulator with XRE-family HTH domain